jgi:GNAT superfamily N-acetyltransferase
VDESRVLQLSRQLKDRTPIPVVPGVTVRTYAGSEDIAAWLAIRQRAFAREKLGVRDWNVEDFLQEFFHKPWWNPERFWLAETDHEPIATVTMALRGEAPRAVPVVHWLAVAPRQRRRGVGRMLIATLEAAAWDDGYREVRLETHVKWDKALALYTALGYKPQGGRGAP